MILIENELIFLSVPKNASMSVHYAFEESTINFEPAFPYNAMLDMILKNEPNYFSLNNHKIKIHPHYTTAEIYSNINSTGQIIAKATTSSVPNMENDYVNNIRIPLNPISVFPQTIPDPTTNSLLEIFILDANNVNLMTSGPAFSCYSPSQYFTWNASTSIMTFNYQSQSQNPQHTTDTNDYFYTASNWNTATLTGPYTYFYLWTTFQQTYTFSSSPILTCSFVSTLFKKQRNINQY